MIIRPENNQDHGTVFEINKSAFGTPDEAGLVDALREQAQPVISLVAVIDSTIVGHIMFSPVTLSKHPELKIMGLAPMAVKPSNQRQGIGLALVIAGLEQCKQLEYSAVVVLGHPEYYPKFGFLPSSRFGIISEYEVPEEVFMVQELNVGFLDGKTGIIQYHAAFGSL